MEVAKEDSGNEQKKFYILRKMDLFIMVKASLSMEIELDVRTSPILMFLKQRQIRLLMRAVQDLVNHRSDRPKPRPGSGRGSKLWWKYTIKRVMEEEFISTRVKKQQIESYLGAERYRYAYTKKVLKSSNLRRGDLEFMHNFEMKNSLSQILILRSLAIDMIIE